MTTKFEEAFPLNTNWITADVRSKLAQCSVFVSSTVSLGTEDFSIQPFAALAVRGNNGALEFYAYDAADTTTADDAGVSCIVVPPGRRYKKRIDVILRDAALTATTTAQPGSPSLGDTYIVPAAPSGTDWASHAKTVATYTARGWIFRQPFVGMLVYVYDEDGFYHYASTGNWVAGLPIGAIGNGVITQPKLRDAFYVVKVEDQRNAPPGGTPIENTRYQVGTSPTGAFSGHANAIARWTALGAWEFIAPAEGDTIYRKDVDTGKLYTYRSGAWVPTVAAAGVQQIKGGVGIALSFSNVTNTIQRYNIALTSSAGKLLRVTIANLNLLASGGNTATNTYNLDFYIDTSGTPLFAIASGTSSTSASPTLTAGFVQHIVAVPDGASHNWNIGIKRTSGNDNNRDFNGTADILIEEMGLS